MIICMTTISTYLCLRENIIKILFKLQLVAHFIIALQFYTKMRLQKNTTYL